MWRREGTGRARRKVQSTEQEVSRQERNSVVARSPAPQGSDPGGGHPRAQMLPLETVNPPLARDVCLDVPGQWWGESAPSVMTDHGGVKQGKSCGSPGTTRNCCTGVSDDSGERPIGTSIPRNQGCP